MINRSKKIIFYFLLFTSLNFLAQDSIVKYRVTTIQTSFSHFFLVGPKYPQLMKFFPSGIISIKSFRTDSLFNPEKKFHFMITFGAAHSAFNLTDPEFYINKLDKSPLYVYSKRYFGGFGLNKRYSVSQKFILDIDVAPCYLFIWDKSVETRGDTALQESKGYEDIYQGLHLLVGAKLEYKTNNKYGFFFSLSATLPLINKLSSNNEDYGDRFVGQIFAGMGMVYFYKTKHKFERDEKEKNIN